VNEVATRLVKRARAGDGPRIPAGRYLPLQRSSRRRHQSRILPLQAGRAALEDGPRSHQVHCELADRRRAMPTQRPSNNHPKFAPLMEAAVKFAIAAPYPSVGRSGEDVYA
jgi:hypothetical protein